MMPNPGGAELPGRHERTNGSSGRTDSAQQLVIGLVAGDSVLARAGGWSGAVLSRRRCLRGCRRLGGGRGAGTRPGSAGLSTSLRVSR